MTWLQKYCILGSLLYWFLMQINLSYVFEFPSYSVKAASWLGGPQSFGSSQLLTTLVPFLNDCRNMWGPLWGIQVSKGYLWCVLLQNSALQVIKLFLHWVPLTQMVHNSTVLVLLFAFFFFFIFQPSSKQLRGQEIPTFFLSYNVYVIACNTLFLPSFINECTFLHAFTGRCILLYEFLVNFIYQWLKLALISLSFNKEMSKNSAY